MKIVRVFNTMVMTSRPLFLSPADARKRYFITNNKVEEYTIKRPGLLVGNKFLFTFNGEVVLEDEEGSYISLIDTSKNRPLLTSKRLSITFEDIVHPFFTEIKTTNPEVVKKLYSHTATIHDVLETNTTIKIPALSTTIVIAKNGVLLAGKPISRDELKSFIEMMMKKLNYGVLQLQNYMQLTEELSNYFNRKLTLAKHQPRKIAYFHPYDYVALKDDRIIINSEIYVYRKNKLNNEMFLRPEHVETLESLGASARAAYSFGDTIVLQDATLSGKRALFIVLNEKETEFIGTFSEEGIFYENRKEKIKILDFPCFPGQPEQTITFPKIQAFRAVFDGTVLSFSIRNNNIVAGEIAERILKEECDLFKYYSCVKSNYNDSEQ